MPERITALHLNRVALVPAGDNPEANIVIWKSRDGNEPGHAPKEVSDVEVTKEPRLTAGRIRRLLGIKEQLDSLIDETSGGQKEGQMENDAVKALLDGIPEDKRDEIQKAIEASEKRAADAEAALEAAKAETTEPSTAEEELTKALAELPEPVRKAFEDQKATADEALAKAESAEAALAKAADDKREADALAKAREFGNLNIKAEDLAPQLAEIRKASPKLADDVEQLLGSVNATASEVLRVIGKDDGAPSEAEDRLDAMAKAYQTTHPELTKEQALTQVVGTPEGREAMAERKRGDQ